MPELPGENDFECRGADETLWPLTAEVYLECFRGYPWYEMDLTLEQVTVRLETDFARCGFDGVWLLAPDGTLITASWYDRPDPVTLEAERGADVRRFAEEYYRGGADVIWLRETIVKPGFQGRGLAKHIKALVHEQVRQQCELAGTPALLLTRMREDNHAIIAVNRRNGYERTGIRVESIQSPGTFHEYWYNRVKI